MKVILEMIMRVTLPEDAEPTSVMTGPGDYYASEIAHAGNEFAYSIYRNSKLPLKIFEAARIATAMVNGCKICMNWRSARDINQLGIKGGVVANGEIPEEEFYAEILSENLENLSHREKLAVRYAKEMGENPKLLSKNEAFWNELKTSFSDMEITDLTYCIAGWMGMGRVAHVLGLDQNCSIS